MSAGRVITASGKLRHRTDRKEVKREMKVKTQKIDAILNQYGSMITGLSDLAAELPPPHFFTYWRTNSAIC